MTTDDNRRQPDCDLIAGLRRRGCKGVTRIPGGLQVGPEKKKFGPWGNGLKRQLKAQIEQQTGRNGPQGIMLISSTSPPPKPDFNPVTRCQQLPCSPSPPSQLVCSSSTSASWDRRPHRLHHLLSRTSILSGLFLIRYLQSCNTLATHKKAIIDHEQKQDSVQCYYAFASLRHATTFPEVSVVGAAEVRVT
jgi:hypothetical protein